MAELQAEVPKLKVRDAGEMPMIGYGTGTAMFKKVDDGKVDRQRVEQIKTALKLGYTHLDAAEVYNTEKEVGVAIKESKIDRSKLFVTTKILPSIADVPAAINASLSKLQLDYVDLYLIHSPMLPSSTEAENDEKLKKAWKEMESVKASGKAREIGVSNFLIPHLESILSVGSTPALNQIEYHLYLQRLELMEFHKKHDIAVAAYAPLTPVTKAAPGPADPLLAQLAKKYYVNESEICMRWCIEKGIVVVTTSSKEQRLSDYLRVAAIRLTPKELSDLDQLGQEKHFRGFWRHKYDENDKR